MLTVRKSEDRGSFNMGWLDTKHSFSFSDYYDPKHMEYRSLRVINEDKVAPSTGFGTHGHRDMEIVTYILSGKLEHKDSLGSGDILKPGDVQYMSAGTGIRHSEFNPSDKEPVHLLQIWIMPDRSSHTPRYGQTHFTQEQRHNNLRLIVSPDGAEGSLPIHQNASIYASLLDAGKTLSMPLKSGRYVWVQIARGQMVVNGLVLNAGDAVAIEQETEIRLEAKEDTEFLLFDLI